MQAAGITLLLSGAFYREFFNRHSHEILSQAGTGEIDSTGALTEAPAVLEWAYYPLACRTPRPDRCWARSCWSASSVG